MKYSFNRANKSNKDSKIHFISYNFYDSHFRGRPSAVIKYKKIGDNETLYIKSINIKKIIQLFLIIM